MIKINKIIKNLEKAIEKQCLDCKIKEQQKQGSYCIVNLKESPEMKENYFEEDKYIPEFTIGFEVSHEIFDCIMGAFRANGGETLVLKRVNGTTKNGTTTKNGVKTEFKVGVRWW